MLPSSEHYVSSVAWLAARATCVEHVGQIEFGFGSSLSSSSSLGLGLCLCLKATSRLQLGCFRLEVVLVLARASGVD